MHWSERVANVLTASTGDLKDLARIAGIDAADLYKFQDLSGCDLRGQDLRGLNLEGCNIERAIVDDATKIDPEWDFRILNRAEEIVDFNISRQLNTMILNFMVEAKHGNQARAQSAILSRGLRIFHTGRYEFYKNVVNSNVHLSRLLSDKADVSVKILLNSRYSYDFAEKIPKEWSKEFLAESMLIGLISRKIRHNSKKDYSQLSPNAFYPPRLVRVEGAMRLVSDNDDAADDGD